MSGVIVDSTDVEVRVKFGDSRSNRDPDRLCDERRRRQRRRRPTDPMAIGQNAVTRFDGVLPKKQFGVISAQSRLWLLSKTMNHTITITVVYVAKIPTPGLSRWKIKNNDLLRFFLYAYGVKELSQVLTTVLFHLS